MVCYIPLSHPNRGPYMLYTRMIGENSMNWQDQLLYNPTNIIWILICSRRSIFLYNPLSSWDMESLSSGLGFRAQMGGHRLCCVTNCHTKQTYRTWLYPLWHHRLVTLSPPWLGLVWIWRLFFAVGSLNSISCIILCLN